MGWTAWTFLSWGPLSEAACHSAGSPGPVRPPSPLTGSACFLTASLRSDSGPSLGQQEPSPWCLVTCLCAHFAHPPWSPEMNSVTTQAFGKCKEPGMRYSPCACSLPSPPRPQSCMPPPPPLPLLCFTFSRGQLALRHQLVLPDCWFIFCLHGAESSQRSWTGFLAFSLRPLSPAPHQHRVDSHISIRRKSEWWRRGETDTF